MARKFFGTDGIRGKANKDPMTAEIALRLGMAAGRYFTRGDHRHAVVIGKDTRLSGYMLEPALTAGFISMGMDVILLGPLPTPAVAMLTRSLRADLGVMISASHNPYEDNGIKLFGPDGYKLSDESELEIEALMEKPELAGFLAPSAGLGKAWRLEDARGRYIEYAKATFPKGLRLDGLKIALDCANGAAYKVAPRVLWELGAEVFETGTSPNGTNINRNCGSQHIDNLSQTVLANQADLGLALDGDADRLILCDEKGQTIDGDQIMALIASNWHKEGLLCGNKVVATLMSNLGLELFLQKQGLELLRTQVGDRYVMEKMREGNYNLGGEQSGHIILADYSTTGDGIIAALQVLAAIKDGGKPASQSLRLFDPLPQLLKNVKGVGDKELQNPRVQAVIKAAEERLKGQGRLLIRKSGTEAMVRVMAEAPDLALIEAVTEDIVNSLRAV